MFTVEAVNEIIREKLEVAPRGSKTRLAQAVGVQNQTVTKWVSGEVTPEQHRWPAIEEALDLDAGVLMAAHRQRLAQHRGGEHRIPEAVAEALSVLGGELRTLRSEVSELRDELHGRVQSSDRGLPARSPSKDRSKP